MQPTRKLFYEDVECHSFCAEVLACVPVPGGFRVALNQTAFYPEGGGQPSDRGALGGARVTDAHEENGVVWHHVTTPLPVGETVQGDIDAARRIDMMQQHTGEHILSGILHALYGCNNAGFHIGEDAVRVDVDCPLSRAQLAEAEYAANRVIQMGGAVETLLPGAQQLASMAYRSKKELSGAVRIVRAGAADVCACCGLHVPDCSRVGQMKILSAQHYKGGMRLAIVCGMRALQDYRAKQDSVAEISALLSAKPEETAAAVQRLAAEKEALQARVAVLETQHFAAAALQAAQRGETVCFAQGLTPDGVRRLALAMAQAYAAKETGVQEASPVCAAFTPVAEGFAYALAGGADARASAKALNEACCGHGGGKPALAQGSVQCSAACLRQLLQSEGFVVPAQAAADTI